MRNQKFETGKNLDAERMTQTGICRIGEKQCSGMVEKTESDFGVRSRSTESEYGVKNSCLKTILLLDYVFSTLIGLIINNLRSIITRLRLFHFMGA